MSIIYRQASKNDYPFLREMLYEALFVPDREIPFLKSTLDLPEISKYIENWASPGDIGIIAGDGDEPIGAVWGRLFKSTNKGYGYIDEKTPELSMAVKINYRNRGIGAELMRRFLILAKEKGYKAVSLSVDKRNRAAGFYLGMGFKIINEAETAYTMKMLL